MEKEFSSIDSALIAATLLTFSRTERVNKFSQTAIGTLACIRKASHMVKENIFGLMAVPLKDSLSKE
jgi:hypothetical protein